MPPLCIKRQLETLTIVCHKFAVQTSKKEPRIRKLGSFLWGRLASKILSVPRVSPRRARGKEPLRMAMCFEPQGTVLCIFSPKNKRFRTNCFDWNNRELEARHWYSTFRKCVLSLTKYQKRFENGESAKPLPGSSHALVR